LERLVRLYRAWGKPDLVAESAKKLEHERQNAQNPEKPKNK
jgi:hypothetical protein